MEKIPVIPEEFMGINDFTSKEEYAYLCVMLMFFVFTFSYETTTLHLQKNFFCANMYIIRGWASYVACEIK